MVAELTASTAALFEDLFANPTIERMLALTPSQFEHFVAHVFTCAGYTVEVVAQNHFPNGPGVDLNLYAGKVNGKPLARVEVKRYAVEHKLYYDDVKDFVGALVIAGGIPGYFVTTSSFQSYAQTAAEAAKAMVRLIDGKRLLRYITYVGGSRLAGNYAGDSVAPVKPTSPAWLERADDVMQTTTRPPRHVRVLAITNTKGGVAKTTTALNVAFALADLHKQRVLVVDMDGQGSLSASVPPPAPADGPTLAEYFRGKATLTATIRETRFTNLFAAPAHSDLYRLQFAGEDRARFELQFAQDVRTLQLASGEQFDWIVIDTPASDSFFGRTALAAADYVLMPALAETYALYGLQQTLSIARTMSALTAEVDAWRCKLLGCVITRWKANRNTEENLASLRTALDAQGIRVYRQAVPVDDRIETGNRATLQGGRRSIFRLNAQMGPAARAYDAVVEEMLADVRRREA